MSPIKGRNTFSRPLCIHLFRMCPVNIDLCSRTVILKDEIDRSTCCVTPSTNKSPMSGETNLRAGMLNYVIFSNRFPPPSKLFASSTPPSGDLCSRPE